MFQNWDRAVGEAYGLGQSGDVEQDVA